MPRQENSSAQPNKQPVSRHTPGPWVAANMVHAERGDAMTPDELGAYVANSIRKSIDDGGFPDRFLFITTTEDNAPDIAYAAYAAADAADAKEEAYMRQADKLIELLEAA